MTKLYPFSVQKYAHDIELYSNHIFCVMHDMEIGVMPMDDIQYNKLFDMRQKVNDVRTSILNTTNGRVAYLTGKQIGLVKRISAWAAEYRGNKNR